MAIQLGTVALGLLTYASYPLFVTILNWLLQRESVRGKDWLAAVAVLIGLGLVVPDWNFGSQAGLASALGLVSGFTFALLTLLNRHLIRDVSSLPLVTVQMAIAGFVLLPLAAPQIFQVTVDDWFWLSLLGVVFTGIAHACFTSSLKTVRVAAVSVAAALEPVYGMLATAIFLREMPTIGDHQPHCQHSHYAGIANQSRTRSDEVSTQDQGDKSGTQRRSTHTKPVPR